MAAALAGLQLVYNGESRAQRSALGDRKPKHRNVRAENRWLQLGHLTWAEAPGRKMAPNTIGTPLERLVRSHAPL